MNVTYYDLFANAVFFFIYLEAQILYHMDKSKCLCISFDDQQRSALLQITPNPQQGKQYIINGLWI